MPIDLGVLTLHWLKNDILQFFKFLQKKVSRLEKKVFPHFWINLGGCKLQNSCGKTSRFIQIVQKIYFVKPGNFFLRKFQRCHFWTNVMSRQPGVWASRPSSSNSVGFEGRFVPKTFRGLHFNYLPMKHI